MEISKSEKQPKNEFIKNEGFKLLSVKYEQNSTVTRHLFLKRIIASKIEDYKDNDPVSRTLFLINVPSFVNEHHIKYLFSEKLTGKIDQIYFEAKPSYASIKAICNKIHENNNPDKSSQHIQSVFECFKHEKEIMPYKACFIVFNKLSGIFNAIQMTETGKTYFLRPSCPDMIDSESNWYTGVRLWQKQYNDSVKAAHELKKIAESYVEEFGRLNEQQEQLEKALAEQKESDEQGWITVNRKLRRDRRALINDRYHDQIIHNKYKDRDIKRRIEEEEFTKQLEPIIKDAIKKKKRKKEINF